MKRKSIIKHIKHDLYLLYTFLEFKKRKRFTSKLLKKVKKLVKENINNVVVYERISKKIKEHFVYKSHQHEEFDDMTNVSIVIKKLLKEPITPTQHIITTLHNNINNMHGDYVVKMNSYEKDFCSLMGWECVDHRYYDCVANGMCIEMKKGTGMMWFDMVRYSEIFLKQGTQNTLTLFIQYDKTKKRVNEIYVIDTDKIVKFLQIDKETAEFAIEAYKKQKRGLNMQASMSKKDMRLISSYIIKRT